jgi:hypothetical protein
MDKSKKPSNPFGIVPLSNFVQRGFGFVHHSIAILCHEVPNLSITIRNFCIAVQEVLAVWFLAARDACEQRRTGITACSFATATSARPHTEDHAERDPTCALPVRRVRGEGKTRSSRVRTP